MAKSLKLLLVENVDDLGIVGDVVSVRTGYARNFLLPRGLATQPDETLVKQLAGKRADAEKLMAQRRKDRESMSDKLKGVEIELVRSCNDMGILYGAITQQDIAVALSAKGYKVLPRDVRISSTIKRVDIFDVHVKLDSDLDAIVKLHVKPDREIVKEAQGESVAAAPAGVGGEGGPRRRDALSMAMEEASKGTSTGWATKKDAPSEDKKSAKKGKEDKGDAKAEAKSESKSEGKSEAKAEKAPKADKPKAEKKPKAKD
jgi:large subunit ribosomal protein L9